ncbi:hypothetical protein BDZ45DRAFT_650149 [Acephala macrosclerotiorum]|nr:hypothetical protein BDZ45DRAFT_650149 [Acephala macrosclerotiorum]
MSKSNKSIRDFFKPAQLVVKPPTPAPALQSPSVSGTSPAPQVSDGTAATIRASNSPRQTISKPQIAQTPSSASKSSDQREQSLSLSPTSSSILSDPPEKESVPLSLSRAFDKERVIQNSDNEDEDSESSLEDLSSFLAKRNSERTGQANDGQAPSTPAASKKQKSTYDFHSSPLAVLPKYKYDLKTLISHVEEDEATEASSKRVKAMLAARNKSEEDHPMFHNDIAKKPSEFAHETLLESVVGEREDGGANKVKRAMKRTEATITESRWYFFDTHSSPARQVPFPVASIPESWEAELVDPNMRYQTFISGFAEDMIRFGKQLPDELFLWMLDEICYDSSEPLRNSYTNILKASSEQVRHLVDPKKIQTLFINLGASAAYQATIITEKIKPVQKADTPYARRDWANLLSVIKLLGRLSKSLQSATKACVICMLLRMSMDRVVCENIDILDAVQETINRLCLSITDEEEWTKCCASICNVLFISVEEHSLRLQMVEVISSIHPHTHDLRRRLAMCFYFNDIEYAKTHSHSIMDLDSFISRLDDPAFDTTSKTDYVELKALIMLMDIALDDGRSTKLDLSDPVVEKKFNEDVEALSAAIKDILTGIGQPGAGFISRTEAREMIDLVSDRMKETLRTKRKSTHTWFDLDKGRKEEDMQSEKKGMASFVSRMKNIGNNSVNK